MKIYPILESEMTVLGIHNTAALTRVSSGIGLISLSVGLFYNLVLSTSQSEGARWSAITAMIILVPLGVAFIIAGFVSRKRHKSSLDQILKDAERKSAEEGQ